MSFKSLISLCETRAFLKRINQNKLSNGDQALFEVAPTGMLLLNNLKNEWINSMIVDRDITVFLSNNQVVSSFEYAKDFCHDQLPFGIAEILQNPNNCKKKFDFDKHFPSDSNSILKTTFFVDSSQSTQFFHQIQKQRRMWWRRFSALPGRYRATELQTDQDNIQRVEIRSEHFGSCNVIEHLALNTSKNDLYTLDHLTFKCGRKKTVARLITSEVSLNSLFFNAIADAYDEALFQGEPRPILRFHRKLAPYKISFSISNLSATTTEELSQLAVYLCKKLRSTHISTLLLPMSVKNSLESQWKIYDQLGVSYNVILNENTLKNGIALLRSRDTTLKEQVHVSNLQTYAQQLFQNY